MYNLISFGFGGDSINNLTAEALGLKSAGEGRVHLGVLLS